MSERFELRPQKQELSNQEVFEKTVPKLCNQEVTMFPKLWSPKNPTIGCCIPISLLAQELFGGGLGRISLRDTKFKNMRFHWFNILPDLKIRDFSASQFGDFRLDYSRIQLRRREFTLKLPGVKEKYWLLKELYTKSSKRNLAT